MASSRKSSKRKSKPSSLKIFIGLLIFISGIYLIFNKDKGGIYLSTTFAEEPVKIEELKLGNMVLGETPERIIIPSLRINLPVKAAKVVSGYWEVFDESAAWGEGSGIPGQKGNQVIFAHAKESLFLPLRSIKLGDKIYVLTKDKYFQYQINEIKEVRPGQTEVIAPTPDETLTLYTCSGFADSKRLIVVGKRL